MGGTGVVCSISDKPLGCHNCLKVFEYPDCDGWYDADMQDLLCNPCYILSEAALQRHYFKLRIANECKRDG